MNQLQLLHEYVAEPDKITVKINREIVYTGDATVEFVNFQPILGTNILTVSLDTKSPGNFFYNNYTRQVENNSIVTINEIIVESRYFRNLVIKCGLVEVDIAKNLAFPSKYIDHENVLTMEGSEYLIKFEYPIKNWMQIHKHGRDLNNMNQSNQLVKDKMKL
jgi:hypothetical protein